MLMKDVGATLKKDKSMKIRINGKQKEYFKEIASKNGMDMSEMVLVATQAYAERKEEQIKSADAISQRANRTEKKIQELKERMNSRREKHNHDKFRILKLFKK